MATMAPERSRTLHNFSLPPRLSWGAHKLLRCSNPNPNNHNDAVSDHGKKRRNSSFRSPPATNRRVSGDGDDQIEAIREKLMLDLRSEVDRMRAALLGSAAAGTPEVGGGVREAETRPWTLRTRRAQTNSVSPAMGFPAGKVVEEEEEEKGGPREKFAVALTRQEIEDDFVEMIGRRPPRKPKKRPRYVQKQLDTLFPGLWLSEITADMYKVDENPDPAK